MTTYSPLKEPVAMDTGVAMDNHENLLFNVPTGGNQTYDCDVDYHGNAVYKRMDNYPNNQGDDYSSGYQSSYHDNNYDSNVDNYPPQVALYDQGPSASIPSSYNQKPADHDMDANGAYNHDQCYRQDQEDPQTPGHHIEALTPEEEAALYRAAMEGQPDAMKTIIQTQGSALFRDKVGDKGRMMLHAAAHARCTDVLRILLGQGASANVQDSEGQTPLHLAVKLSHVDVVDCLLAHGANVNIEDDQGRTPMQLCLNIDTRPSKSDQIIINMLLPMVDFSICDFDGISTFHCLAYWDLWSPLETILKLCCTPGVKDNRGRTPLHYAFMNPSLLALDAAYILVRNEASIMVKDFDGKTPIQRLMAHPMTAKTPDALRFMRDFICTEVKVGENMSLVHASTISADTELLRFMGRCGADLNKQDPEGNSPLHVGVMRNHSDVVRTLLHTGANAEAKDARQQSPLHLAASQSRLTAAKLLLAEGAPLEQTDERGRTPLHCGVHSGSLEVVKLLINSGSNVNALDNTESLPLHYAAAENRLEVVEMLLLRGSKVNFSDLEGRTALHAAVRTGNSDIIRILVMHGCSVNDYDKYGQTPLHMAAECGKSDAVQTLMNRGADDSLRDGEGRIAEQVAKDKGSVRVMKVMQDHRDSMILYSQENLVDMDYLGQSRTNMSSNNTLDAIDERESIVSDVTKPSTNGMSSLSKFEQKSARLKCGCCVIL